MNKLNCQKCGIEISNEFGVTLVYCTNCGASIQNLSAEKTAAFGDVQTQILPNSPTNNSPPKSKMTRNLLGCLGYFCFRFSAFSGIGCGREWAIRL